MYTYIVIDDESLIRKGTIKKLESMDCVKCIGEASDGEEALRAIGELDPDIIITDMDMPVMDGTKLLPILAGQYASKRIIVISGYKDFEYMKHAIWASAVDYLLKPLSRETLQNSVKKAIEFIENSAEIQNQIISREEEAEAAHFAHDVQLLKGLVVNEQSANFLLTSKKLLNVSQTHNYLLITLHSARTISHEELSAFLAENGFGDLALCLQHPTSGHIALFLLFVPKQSTFAHYAFCRQITEHLTVVYGPEEMNFSFGISNVHPELRDLHMAFLETVNALNSATIHDTNHHYVYEKDCDDPETYLWDKADELLFRMETGMSEELQRLLEELYLFFDKMPDCTISSAKFFYYQLSNHAKITMHAYFERINADTISASMKNILNTIFSLEELRQYYDQFFLNICNVLKDKNAYSGHDVVEQIKIYAQRNYHKSLNMDYVASLFFLSRSYCSHLFKEKAGINFVDYVTQIRIQKAQQLIEHSDKKMYQIAKMVGYNNVKYFFRLFKKVSGMTPEDYKATHSK